ncbi:hypothetical protein FJZ31_06755 [Candidatus Poribacteria bacterium]|nr:hypothetical protein [Candidatus Poribacteria bacterium]
MHPTTTVTSIELLGGFVSPVAGAAPASNWIRPPRARAAECWKVGRARFGPSFLAPKVTVPAWLRAFAFSELPSGMKAFLRVSDRFDSRRAAPWSRSRLTTQFTGRQQQAKRRC